MQELLNGIGVFGTSGENVRALTSFTQVSLRYHFSLQPLSLSLLPGSMPPFRISALPSSPDETFCGAFYSPYIPD